MKNRRVHFFSAGMFAYNHEADMILSSCLRSTGSLLKIKKVDHDSDSACNTNATDLFASIEWCHKALLRLARPRAPEDVWSVCVEH